MHLGWLEPWPEPSEWAGIGSKATFRILDDQNQLFGIRRTLRCDLPELGCAGASASSKDL